MVLFLRDQLTPLIRPRYLASVGERVYVEGAEQRPIGPDVWLREAGRQGGGRAMADVAVLDEPVLVEVPDVEIREPYIFAAPQK
jgi:hypothetical protein